MLEANYLSILLKPTYENPVDGAEDVLERGLKIIGFPGMELEMDMMSPSKITRDLAESTVVAEVIF